MVKARHFIFILITALALISGRPAFAVNPGEILPDAQLEERARELSSIIRCMKCQNQSIDDSDADLAKDLRILVRERLVEGDSDQEVLDYLVDRYGEFVLLKPQFSLTNLALWGIPVLTLMLALFFSWRLSRKPAADQSASRKEEVLTQKEQKLLTKILSEDD